MATKMAPTTARFRTPPYTAHRQGHTRDTGSESEREHPKRKNDKVAQTTARFRTPPYTVHRQEHMRDAKERGTLATIREVANQVVGRRTTKESTFLIRDLMLDVLVLDWHFPNDRARATLPKLPCLDIS